MCQHDAEAILKQAVRGDSEEASRLAEETAGAGARAKGRMLAQVSHDLRTPLAGILGMVQLALEEEMAPQARVYLDTTLQSARALLRILNDLLDMSRIESGLLAIEAEPFLLRWCVREAVEIMQPELQAKGLDLELTVTPEVPEAVVGDQARLRQVLVHLIDSAARFSDGGEVGLRVGIGPLAVQGSRHFTFGVDTGVSEQDRHLLREAFGAEPDRDQSCFGAGGLGLAICRELVALMGGEIRFQSGEGRTCRFTFSIPLREIDVESEARSVRESPPMEPAPAARVWPRLPRLLLVEDDPVIRQFLGRMLRQSSFALDIAEDGRQAVEMWDKGDYDLVLMDIEMPRLNGFQATRAIRDRERDGRGHTPIIAMTAYTLKEDEEKCRAAGADAYISKPINFQNTLRVIGALLQNKLQVSVEKQIP